MRLCRNEQRGNLREADRLCRHFRLFELTRVRAPPRHSELTLAVTVLEWSLFFSLLCPRARVSAWRRKTFRRPEVIALASAETTSRYEESAPHRWLFDAPFTREYRFVLG